MPDKGRQNPSQAPFLPAHNSPRNILHFPSQAGILCALLKDMRGDSKDIVRYLHLRQTNDGFFIVFLTNKPAEILRKTCHHHKHHDFEKFFSIILKNLWWYSNIFRRFSGIISGVSCQSGRFRTNDPGFLEYRNILPWNKSNCRRMHSKLSYHSDITWSLFPLIV